MDKKEPTVAVMVSSHGDCKANTDESPDFKGQDLASIRAHSWREGDNLTLQAVRERDLP